MKSKYGLAVCGGTFDHFHDGHKKFIQEALNFSNNLIIGITSDHYVSKYKNISGIESFNKRKQSVIEFLNTVKSLDKVEIIAIDNGNGSLLDENFKPQAIFVTSNTLSKTIQINKERIELGLPELKIEIVEMVKAGNGELISSSRIRNGEIRRDRRLYIKKTWQENNLFITDEIRAELKKPLGKLIYKIPEKIDPFKTITVGDTCTKNFNDKKINQFLSILDLHIKREKKFDNLSELGFEDGISVLESENPPGTISKDLIEKVKQSFETKKRKVILINGEDDLAVLIAILIAPLSYIVFYGQPYEGMVEVEITEEAKEKAYNFVSKFKLK